MIKKIGTWIGTIAGAALGSFLYGIEKLTGLSVYTLLMNVDFIPVIRHAMGHPVLEWLLHLMISWAIGMVFVYILERWNKQYSPFRFPLSVILSLGVSSAYIPLTILSIRPTPSVRNGKAGFYWVTGHTIFGLVLVGSYDLLKVSEDPVYA